MKSAAPLQALTTKPQSKSTSPLAGSLLQRKCACGSPASSLTGQCESCTSRKVLQTKLAVGASSDPLEQEADRVADHVLAAPRHSAVCLAPPSIQRYSGQASEGAAVAPASIDRVLASSGRPLEPALRQDMEQRFGHDLSQVRVHSDEAAAQSARDVNANAYTAGHDIVFGAGRYTPGTQSGQRLIAHELTHVVQQAGRPGLLLRQTGNAPVPKAVNTPSATQTADILDHDERVNLLGDTRSRVDQAFVAFGIACTAHRDAIKNEAKARAELWAAVIDIATGFGAPVFAGAATASLAAKAAKKAAEAGATAMNKEKVFSLISQSDFFKASFTAASKAATAGIKGNSMTLFGETDIDKFAELLRVSFHAGAQELNSSLNKVDDTTLLSLWAAYDVEFTNESVYKSALKNLFDRYRAQIRPIGTQQVVSSLVSYTQGDTRAYWMDAYGKVRLALLQDQTDSNFVYTHKVRTFQRWVSPDLVELAVKVTEERFGKVETIDPATINGHIPDPETGK